MFIVTGQIQSLTNLAAPFVAVGTIPAATGALRLSNADAINVRNANNNGDFNVISFDSSSNLVFGDGGMPRISFATGPCVDFPTEIQLANSARLVWGANADVGLFRDGAWELGLRDGTNDMFFYVYGTFTDASNYERLAVYAGDPVNHFIESQSAGSGSNDINMTIRPLGNGSMTIGPATIGGGGVQNYRAASYSRTIGTGNARYTIQRTRQVSGVLASGSTFTFTNIIPAGAWIKAIYTIVTSVITGATGYDVGDGVDPDRWGAAVGAAQGQLSDMRDYTDTVEAMFLNPALADVVITANGADFTAGEVTCIVISELYAAGGIS